MAANPASLPQCAVLMAVLGGSHAMHFVPNACRWSKCGSSLVKRKCGDWLCVLFKFGVALYVIITYLCASSQYDSLVLAALSNDRYRVLIVRMARSALPFWCE